jgi:hypothetical protein
MFSADNFSAQNLMAYLAFFKNKTPEAIKKVDVKTVEGLLVHTILPRSILYTDATLDTSIGDLVLHAKSNWQNNAPAPDTFTDVVNNSSTEIHLVASSSMVDKLLSVYKDEPSPSHKKEAASNSSVKSNTKDVFDIKVGQYLQQGSISMPQFTAILDLEKEQHSVDDFTEKLNAMKLPADVSNQLLEAYKLSMKTQAVTKKAIDMEPVQTPASLLRDLLGVGYLQKDKDHYTTTIEIVRGVIKVNGITIQTK